MKRYFALILALALFATMFVGCRGKDNVSHNESGKIEDTKATTPTTASTAPSTAATTESTTEGGIMDNMIPDGSSESNSTNESSSNNEENTPMGRSRRGAPKFCY